MIHFRLPSRLFPLVVLLASVSTATPQPARAWLPAPAQEFVVPGADGDLAAFIDRLLESRAAELRCAVESDISLVVSASGTVLTWDHHEDGFEPDQRTPRQTTTVVWGDGDPSNGQAPGHHLDRFESGALVRLDSASASGRTGAFAFGDGDRLSASRPVALSRSFSAQSPPACGDSVRATLGVLDSRHFGHNFTVPVGEPARKERSGRSPFELVSVALTAGSEEATVRRSDTGETRDLEPGSSTLLQDVAAGTKITASSPVHASLLTGEAEGEGTANTHWITLHDDSALASSYLLPARSDASRGEQWSVWLHNPGRRPLEVEVTVGGEPEHSPRQLRVHGGHTIEVSLPSGGAARLASRDGRGFVALATSASTARSSQSRAAALALVPEHLLTEQVLVAPPSREESAALWVTASRPTTVYVNFDGRGANQPPYDAEFTLAGALSTLQLDDRDRDLAATRIFTVDGTPLAAVWTTGPRSSNVWDGAAVLPVPELLVHKTSAIKTGEALLPGGRLLYELTIRNEGTSTIAGLSLFDQAPIWTTYLTGTTRIDRRTIGAQAPVAPLRIDDRAGETALTSGIELGGLPPGQEIVVSFEVELEHQLPLGVQSVGSTAIVRAVGRPTQTASAIDRPIQPSLGLSKHVYPGHDNGQRCPAGGPHNVEAPPNAPITYCFTLINDGNVTLEVALEDEMLGGGIEAEDMIHVAGPTDGRLPAGESLVLAYPSDARGTRINRARATGTPLGSDGQLLIDAAVEAIDTAVISVTTGSLEIDLLIDGHDADTREQAVRAETGTRLEFVYRLSNWSAEDLFELHVQDDQNGTLDCPQTTLAAGESVECRRSVAVDFGTFATRATASGRLASGGTVKTDDLGHHEGFCAQALLENIQGGEALATLRATRSPSGSTVASFAAPLETLVEVRAAVACSQAELPRPGQWSRTTSAPFELTLGPPDCGDRTPVYGAQARTQNGESATGVFQCSSCMADRRFDELNTRLRGDGGGEQTVALGVDRLGDAYFAARVSSSEDHDGDGQGDLDGTTTGWCADPDTQIAFDQILVAQVVPVHRDDGSIDASRLAGAVARPENLPAISWILSQDWVDRPAPVGAYTFGDVQQAIWLLADHRRDVASIRPFQDANAADIARRALVAGHDFAPSCEVDLPVLLEPRTINGIPQQPVFAATSFARLVTECVDSCPTINQPRLLLRKLTNGVDSDSPEALDLLQVRPGDSLLWTYIAENVGNEVLFDVALSDADLDLEIACPADTTLRPGEQLICQASGIAAPGLRGSEATARARSRHRVRTAHSNASFYSAENRASVAFDKQVRLCDSQGCRWADADSPSEVIFEPGDTIEFRFLIVNDGDVALDDLVVRDDTLEDCTASSGFTLEPGGVATCRRVTVAGSDPGQFVNEATLEATPAGASEPIVARDLAYWRIVLLRSLRF